MYNILVCDDDKDIVEAVSIYLETSGYNVIKAYNGIEAVEAVKNEDIHLIVIDIMMPEMDGIRATRMIRETSSVPVIFLSAKSEDADKILGLDIGADDYVTKPFSPLELVARVKSQLRRYTQLGTIAESSDDKIIRSGGLEINDSAKQVSVDGEEIKLTPIEYDILLYLMENQGRVFTTGQIYEAVWNEDALGADNIIAVHIRHLREKTEKYSNVKEIIKTIWGVGYMVDE